MYDINTIIKDLIKTRNLQKFVNRRFKDESVIIMPKSACNICKYIIVDYATFRFDDMVWALWQLNDYNLDDL